METTPSKMTALMHEFGDLAPPPSMVRSKRDAGSSGALLAAIDAAIVKSRPDWSAVRVERASIYIPDLPKSKVDLHERREPVEASGVYDVQIAQAPFSRGGVRVAHYARVNVNGTWKDYVAKQFIEPKNQTRDQVLGTLEGNSVTKFLAAEWMRTAAGKATGKVVECIEARALRVSRDGREVWYHLEGLIPAKFEKWTDNGGYAEPTAPALLRFSEWTHTWTDGFMMVTDIQGAETARGYTLTDPAVLCKDLSRFQPTNFHRSQLIMCLSAIRHALKGAAPRFAGTKTSYSAGFSATDDGSAYKARLLAMLERSR
jgi:hypothetical protein